MDSYEDFEFSSPLSVSEALDRLKKHATNPRDGTFYGEVMGNYFNISHDAGGVKVNPQLSGYILSEGTGCKVFARTQVVGSLDKYAYVAMTSLGALVYFFIRTADYYDRWIKVITNYRLLFSTLFLLIFIGGPIAGWRVMKKFKKEGRFQVISKFMDYLDAGYKIGLDGDN